MNSDFKRLRMKEIDAMAQQLAEHIGVELKRMVPCCINCLHWNDENSTCSLAKATPPPKVIAFGCPSFDDCPF